MRTNTFRTANLLRVGALVAAVLLAITLVTRVPRGSAEPKDPAAAYASLAAQLPTGTTITPAGSEVSGRLGLIPQAIAISPNGRWLATSDSGNDTKTVSFTDLSAGKVVQVLDLKRPSFAGIAFKDNDTVYVSGGTNNALYVLKRGADGSFAISGQPIPTGYYPALLTFDPARRFLYVANDMSNNLTVIDTASGPGTSVATVPTGDHPYGVALAGDRLYVSNWGGATVSEYQVVNGIPVPTGAAPNPGGYTDVHKVVSAPTTAGRVAQVGSHPTALAVDSAHQRLYVTDGNDDAVSVIDTVAMREIARVRVSPALAVSTPRSSAPGALAFDGAGHLLVANGGNNAIAVVDLKRAETRPGAAVLGYIPTGWYPSALALVGDQVYYANAKGDGPDSLSAGGTGVLFEGRGVPPRGTLWHVSLSSTQPQQLARYTSAVVADNRWRSLPGNVTAAGTPLANIHHVVFVLRENKTYDEEFSDVRGGNGQQCQTRGQVATWHSDTRAYTCPDGKPPLLMYGRAVTPNNHALAQRWSLLDNFDIDAETSIIGHQWATASQLSDFAQRTYGSTEGWTSQEPGFVPQNGTLDIATPGGGYLFTNIVRSGHSARVYSGGYDATPVSARPDNVADIVRSDDLLVPLGVDSGLYPDTVRVQEFERDVSQNGLADFSYVWLPDDHTVGGLPGNLTPQSQVATNDLATGQLVDFLSRSQYWHDTAVFIEEDDPQGGQDHVSGYRSIFMLASPWAKKGFHTSQRYDMSSLLRTIELILDVPAISQNDLTGLAMTDLFTSEPDFTPYSALTPDVPPTLNPPQGPWTASSRAIDFTRVDPHGDGGEELNRILLEMARAGDRGLPMNGRYGSSVAEQWAALVAAGRNFRSLWS